MKTEIIVNCSITDILFGDPDYMNVKDFNTQYSATIDFEHIIISKATLFLGGREYHVRKVLVDPISKTQIVYCAVSFVCNGTTYLKIIEEYEQYVKTLIDLGFKEQKI